MCAFQWASEQTHVGMKIEISKPKAVCDGTHFKSTIVHNRSNETATSYS